jgi:hypothetical protein
MAASSAEGLARLREAAESGELEVDPRPVLEASRAVEQYGEYVRQVAAYVQNRSGGR